MNKQVACRRPAISGVLREARFLFYDGVLRKNDLKKPLSPFSSQNSRAGNDKLFPQARYSQTLSNPCFSRLDMVTLRYHMVS
jgi:hypothetical protein